MIPADHKLIDLRDLGLHNVYAGTLDLINGTQVSPESIDDLKHLALFYDHIIIPDGLAFAYGPVTSHVHRLLEESRYSIDYDPLVSMGRAGILVPAIRNTAGLYDTWRGRLEKVYPGVHLCLRDESASHEVLEKLVDMFPVCADAGEPLNEMRSARLMGWENLIKKFLLNKESPVSLERYIAQQPSDAYPAEAWVRVRQMAETFIGQLERRVVLSDFRRGHIEDDVAKAFGYSDFEPSFERTIYSIVLDEAQSALPEARLRAGVASYMLSALTTTYQARQAASLVTYGGLFNSHHRGIISLGLYDQLGAESGAVQVGYNDPAEPLFSGVVDFSDLSIDSICTIRSESIFKDGLRGYFHDWLVAVTREPDRYKDSTSRFCKFLNKTYIPRVLEESPRLKAIESRLTAYSVALAAEAALAGYVSVGAFCKAIVTVVSVASPLLPRLPRLLNRLTRDSRLGIALGQYARCLNPLIRKDQ